MKRPTLETVAAVAEVSRSTVSRVMNGSGRVSPAVRARVLAVIEELGYVPNQAARALASSYSKRRTHSGTIAVINCTGWGQDPVSAEIVIGIRDEMTRAGGHVVWLSAANRIEAEQCVTFARERVIDGAILLCLPSDHPLPGLLRRAGVPTVAFGRPLSNQANLTYVDAENYAGAEGAVRWLIEHGRRRVGIIAGRQDMSAGVDRLAGSRAVIEGAELVEMGDFSIRGGAWAMRALLRQQPRLDAVFAASDLMAVGAMQVLREAGRRVPDDVALIGFDGVFDDDCDHLPGPGLALTTVRQPLRQMGRRMARQIITGGTQPAIFPTELVLGASA